MWSTVAYSSIPCVASPAFPNGYIAHRPILKVTLLANGKTLDCYADVDSGADQCVFPASFATQLGLDALSNPRVAFTGGVGSSQVPTQYWNITILIALPATVALRLEVDAGFTPGLDQLGIGLLGQAGFFDRVRVCFDHRNGLFQIETPDP